MSSNYWCRYEKRARSHRLQYRSTLADDRVAVSGLNLVVCPELLLWMGHTFFYNYL
jgi:hypothetical protein